MGYVKVGTISQIKQFCMYLHHRGRWDGLEELTPQNFTRVFTDFGVCHTFNGGFDGEELKKVQIAGNYTS